MSESDVSLNDDLDEDIFEEEENLDPKKRGLGRGLGALFEDDEEGPSPSAAISEASAPDSRRLILGIDQVSPGPFQPRKDMDEEKLDELTRSIMAHGVLQPLLVRPIEGEPNNYHIVAGERRWRAAQRAQLHEVPVVVRELSVEEALEIALIENLQREDLNPLDEAQGYQRLQEEFEYTQEKLAAELGKSRSHIANMMRLTALSPTIQGYIRQGELTAGHGRALLTAENPEDLARRIIDEGLSVREAEKFAKGAQISKPKGSASKPSAKQEKSVDTLALEKEISDLLGMTVTIDMQGNGGGSLKVAYRSLDQLDELLHKLSHFPGGKLSG